ncbi:MAG: O-antigen ligase family protein, partial [Bacteroidota bacterium]
MIFGLSQERLSRDIYYFGLVLLALSLPLSNFTMSIAQFMIAGSWVIGGNFADKLKRFFTSPITLLFFAVYLMHVLGLLWTSDMDSGMRDVRIKLPLLLLPLLMSTSPSLPMVRFEWVLRAVGIGVLISTVIGYCVYLGIIPHEVRDIRDISIFISHIRLSLLACVSVFIGVWFINRKGPSWESLIWMLAIAWFMFFVLLLQSLTAMLILAVFLAIYLSVIAFRGRMLLVRIGSMVVLVVCLFAIARMFYLVNDAFALKDELKQSGQIEKTLSGNLLVTDYGNAQLENGYYVWKNLCEEELRQQWNKRSEMPYDGRDRKNNELRMTLIRFLTSKGLQKDSAAIASLTDQEIMAIESGIANDFYLRHSGLTSRLHQAVWEYRNYQMSGDPTGHSLTQRLEYWQTGLNIIASEPITGVGTGDLQQAFNNQYEQNGTKLSMEWRLRAHNQYISIAAAFGIFGLLLFMTMLFWPIPYAAKMRDHLYLAFLATVLLSMLSEDTLETQAGITFFVFFSGLFLFVHPINKYAHVKKSNVGPVKR